MYYAVAADGLIMSVESTAQAALDTMRAIASLRFNRPAQLVRFVTDARAFADFSNGKAQRLGYTVCDGRMVPVVE